ncbi:hypothetical protein ACL02T_21795 [Pseudonocardia sp. RS010]|uniref:hypothetical protein n=1 Tax=Pseudonocardia sp. RS010 TaxID=3385979 RepID=UPI0039A19BD4
MVATLVFLSLITLLGVAVVRAHRDPLRRFRMEQFRVAIPALGIQPEDRPRMPEDLPALPEGPADTGSGIRT